MIKHLSHVLKKHFSIHFSRAKFLSQMVEGVIKARHVHLYRITEEFSKTIRLIKGMLHETDSSPQQISGRLETEGIAVISHETIYKHVWKDKREGGTLYINLRHSGKKYNKRKEKTAGIGLISNRVDISLIPTIVDTKSRIGDFEGDTIIGAKHHGDLLPYVDRQSKYVIFAKLPDKSSASVVKATQKHFKTLPHQVKTITFDNGKEFADHVAIGKNLKEDIYYFSTP